MKVCDEFIDYRHCPDPKNLDLPHFLAALTPAAWELVLNVGEFLLQLSGLAQSGQAEGLALSSAQLRQVAELKQHYEAATGGSQPPVPLNRPITPLNPPIINIMEQCIKQEFAKFTADGVLTEKEAEEIIVNCVEPYFPGVKKFSSCLACIQSAAYAATKNNENPLSAVLTHCSSCGNPWFKLPMWARILIVLAAIVAVLALIGAIANAGSS